MNDAPTPADSRFTRDPSASNAAPNTSSASSDEESDPAYDSAYIPPRVKPLGTLPASTGMPISEFPLGPKPKR